MDSRELGRWGEQQAARYLRRRGYAIVAMNYGCRQGEIDLIARRRGCIVFVEVKLRKDAAFAEAREFVTRAKQARIMAAAQLWLCENETELQPRFDVIEIYAPDGVNGRARIAHIENAFE
ncbi:MAG: YraN family protein [Oscillospiraceae bacterium]|nr:YraN family protein [Oscillospiraceae bacterium]